MKVQKVLFALLLVIVVAGTVFTVRALKNKAQMPSPASVQTETSGTEKSKGPASAKVTLVEYSDFQCPACRAAMTVVHDLFKAYPDQIRLVYRHFPLQMHVWSPLVHQAAECANSQGKFWEFHDTVFVEQPSWSGPANPTDKMMNIASTLGLDLAKFGDCLKDPAVTVRISEDRQKGETLQIRSTPTFFLNGEMVVGPAELKSRGENMIRSALGLPPLPSAPPPPPVSIAAPAASASAMPSAPMSQMPVSSTASVSSSSSQSSSAPAQ